MIKHVHLILIRQNYQVPMQYFINISRQQCFTLFNRPSFNVWPSFHNRWGYSTPTSWPSSQQINDRDIEINTHWSRQDIVPYSTCTQKFKVKDKLELWWLKKEQKLAKRKKITKRNSSKSRWRTSGYVRCKVVATQMIIMRK